MFVISFFTNARLHLSARVIDTLILLVARGNFGRFNNFRDKILRASALLSRSNAMCVFIFTQGGAYHDWYERRTHAYTTRCLSLSLAPSNHCNLIKWIIPGARIPRGIIFHSSGNFFFLFFSTHLQHLRNFKVSFFWETIQGLSIYLTWHFL